MENQIEVLSDNLNFHRFYLTSQIERWCSKIIRNDAEHDCNTPARLLDHSELSREFKNQKIQIFVRENLKLFFP